MRNRKKEVKEIPKIKKRKIDFHPRSFLFISPPKTVYNNHVEPE